MLLDVAAGWPKEGKVLELPQLEAAGCAGAAVEPKRPTPEADGAVVPKDTLDGVAAAEAPNRPPVEPKGVLPKADVVEAAVGAGWPKSDVLVLGAAVEPKRFVVLAVVAGVVVPVGFPKAPKSPPAVPDGCDCVPKRPPVEPAAGCC